MSQELGIKLEKSFFFDGYQLPANTRLPYRTVEMYELDCFSKSEGGIVLGEKNIRFEANTVNFRIPGQYVCGVMPYRGTGLYFSANNLPYPLDGVPFKIVGSQAKKLTNIAEEIRCQTMNTGMLSNLTVQSKLLLLLRELYLTMPVYQESYRQYNRYLRPVIEYVHRHLDEQIPIESLLQISGLSKSYFHKMFKQTLGRTPNEYITEQRLERAKQLMQLTNQKMEEIALQCGFLDPVYFSYVFKKETGQTPTQYRKAL